MESAPSEKEIISRYLPLIKNIVEEISHRLPYYVTQSYVLKEDLVSSGYVGLMEAIIKYKPSNGAPFKLYAEKRIRGAIKDELRNNDYLSRCDRKQVKQIKQIEQIKISTQSASLATSFINLSQKQYSKALILSSIKHCSDNILKYLPSFSENQFETYLKKEQEKIVLLTVKSMPKKCQRIFKMRYIQNMSQVSISTQFKCSESWISQMLNLIRKHIKAHINEDDRVY